MKTEVKGDQGRMEAQAQKTNTHTQKLRCSCYTRGVVTAKSKEKGLKGEKEKEGEKESGRKINPPHPKP